jgi:methionyl aminopeptidase
VSSRREKKFSAMARAGEISSSALKAVLSEVKEGVTLLQLDSIAEEVIVSAGAAPAFKRVEEYPFTTCINVNEGIVHGIPNEYVLKKGDVVSIDLGAYYEGYNSDQCWTMEVGSGKASSFLSAGELALKKAISQAREGNHVGDISHAMQQTIENAGFHVSRDLVGHGIGKNLHEAPQVPCYGNPGTGQKLKVGMCLAIEVIYALGDPSIESLDDGWTLVTTDGGLSAVFEHTVGVTEGDPLVFTAN